MRPPELPGGKNYERSHSPVLAYTGFNEAAGITRRKDQAPQDEEVMPQWCFNEAAGITRRKGGYVKRHLFAVLGALQ